MSFQDNDTSAFYDIGAIRRIAREIVEITIPVLSEEYQSDDESGEDEIEELIESPREQSLENRDVFGVLCPCENCDEYKGQIKIIQHATFKHPITVEDFSEFTATKDGDFF